MPIDVKEVLNYVFGDDAAGIDNMDKFKEAFQGETARFVPVKELNDPKSESFKKFLPKAVGTIAGKTQSALKKRLAELDVELTADDLKDKPLETIVDSALEKVVTGVKTKYADYDTKLKQNTDDRVASLTTELGTLKTKYESLDGLHNALKTQYDTDTTDLKNKLTTSTVKTLREAAHREHVKLIPGTSELAQIGYYAEIERDFDTRLNEAGDDLDVFDRKTGKQIPNPAHAGTYKGYKDVLADVGRKHKIWSENDGARRMNQNNFNFAVGNSHGSNANGGNNEGGQQQQQPQSDRKRSSRVMQ